MSSNSGPSAVKNLQQFIHNKKNNFLVNKVVTKKIGSQSANGAVFKLNGPGGRKVLKIVKSPGGIQEAAFQRNMARLNFSPKVHNVIANVEIPSRLANEFFSQKSTTMGSVKINAIIMNNLQQSNTNKVMSLHNYLSSSEYSNTQKQNLFNKLGNMVNTMAKNSRIIHGDLHPHNVYVILSPGKPGKPLKPPKLFIIDYGRSRRTGIPTRAMTKACITHRLVANVNDPYYGKMVYNRNGTPCIFNNSKLNILQKHYGLKPRTRFTPY